MEATEEKILSNEEVAEWLFAKGYSGKERLTTRAVQRWFAEKLLPSFARPKARYCTTTRLLEQWHEDRQQQALAQWRDQQAKAAAAKEAASRMRRRRSR